MDLPRELRPHADGARYRCRAVCATAAIALLSVACTGRAAPTDTQAGNELLHFWSQTHNASDEPTIGPSRHVGDCIAITLQAPGESSPFIGVLHLIGDRWHVVNIERGSIDDTQQIQTACAVPLAPST